MIDAKIHYISDDCTSTLHGECTIKDDKLCIKSYGSAKYFPLDLDQILTFEQIRK